MSLFVACRRGIACRMYVIVALAVLAVGALAGASIYFANVTGHAAQVLYENSLAGVIEATDLELLLEKHRRVIEAAPLEFDRNQLRKDRRVAEDIVTRIEVLVSRPGDQLAERIAASLPEFVFLGREVLHYSENFAQQKGLETVDLYAKSADRIQDRIRMFRQERVNIADAETTALAWKGKLLVNWVTTLAIAALLLIGPLSLVLIRSVVMRLRRITIAMGKLARNETHISIETTDEGDEIGEMARAVEVFKTNAITLLDQKARLEQLNLWLDIALNNMARGLSMFDAREHLVVCNANYLRMYGLPAEMARPGTRFDDILGRRLNAIAPGLEAGHDERFKIREVLAKVVVHRQEGRFSQTLKDGRIIEVSMRPLETGGWVALHEDVTEQRRASEHIARLARHDPMTGLANRLKFRERLEEHTRLLGTGPSFALHCIDLDKFKEVNDTHGHPAGDALLKAVARRLESTVRSGDVVARLGGDEFAVVQLGATTQAEAAALARRLIDAVSEPLQVLGHRIEVGATVGIALAPGDGSNPDDLLKHADMALYRAKADGRGRYSFFDPAMEGRLRARRILESDLHAAVTARQFELHYQPIVSLERGRISGCEALIRWRHPERGMISPADFIPVAEDIGLIQEIGAWGIGEACRAAALWPDPVTVAVNQSAAQFGTSDLVAIVGAALEASGLEARRLELEVTGSLILDQDPATVETLHSLRRLGVRIALDDFGTGYSSLSYLRSFPFDKIKIDQSFVRDLSQRPDCVAIVGAVAQLAKSLSMATVAEGVETEDHLAKVRASGCTEAQGYLFSRPVRGKDIVAVIAACNARLAREFESVEAAA